MCNEGGFFIRDLNFELDRDREKTNQCAKYLRVSRVIELLSCCRSDTQNERHTHGSAKKRQHTTLNLCR